MTNQKKRIKHKRKKGDIILSVVFSKIGNKAKIVWWKTREEMNKIIPRPLKTVEDYFKHYGEKINS